jgi:hypothetical protein
MRRFAAGPVAVLAGLLHCPRCGGRRRIVAVHTRAETLRPLLARLGLAVAAAATRASRSPPALAG